MATQSEAIYNQLFVVQPKRHFIHQKHLRINTPFPFGYFDSKQIQIDPLWSHCYLKPQKENKTMQQKWELTILKANRLGAAGFKVCGVEVQQDDFVLMTEPFSQAEIDEFSLKRSNILSNEKIALVNRIIQRGWKRAYL